MIFSLVQIAAIVGLAISFYGWKSGLQRRNAQSWDSLVARLRLNSMTRSLGDQSIWNGNLNVTPEEKWRLIRGAHGLWTMYENAGVMLEMADYAARNGESVDPELLATLRSDAMQIRVCVLSALTRYALSQMNEGIGVNVTRAAAVYTEMTARTAELLAMNGRQMAPNFMPAM
ncbi:MAG TPA: hypothetical protein VMW15_10755 [Terracidiphilus sp.]|jgi:hypothetical protein|nr:hypothetical protein [Terracidiphilus sp.]